MASNFAQQRALQVAIVPGGNGAWAAAQGLSRAAGDRAGVEAARRTVGVAPGLGIGTLTLHALCDDDGWEDGRRPAAEVRSILDCVGELLASETATWLRNGVRVSVMGRRDRLPGDLVATIERAEATTGEGRALHLRLAVDYSARDAIVAALASARPSRMPGSAAVARALGSDVDLLVRTGGEQRLGDFLLWECAHAELLFAPKPWPEFGADDLAAAVVDFHRRQCRRGGLAGVPAAGARA